MTRVLVTGGTGVLGRQVAASERLREAADVRVLSRTARPGADGTQVVHGDLETGTGLAAALAGVDVVVHCASPGDNRHPQRDVAVTRALLDAARAPAADAAGTADTAGAAGAVGGVGGVGAAGAAPHIVYISIVGVDRIPLGYYRAKLDAERLVENSGLPWTILRTTQFHDLVLALLMQLARGPAVVTPRGVRVQPVDAGEVAERMVGLALAAPAGRVADLGGPQVLAVEEAARMYLAATRSRKPVLPLPAPGKVAAGFRAGGHLPTSGDRGVRTFEDYLRARINAGGTVTSPYDLKARRRASSGRPARTPPGSS